MAREHNFLLGQGERMAKRVTIQKGGSSKSEAYDLATATARIGKDLHTAQDLISDLPEDACPRGETVAVVTLHPRFLSKTDFPEKLFRSVGIRPIGSRAAMVRPDAWGIKKHPEEAITEELFVAGARTAFQRWSDNVESWESRMLGADELCRIEHIRVPKPEDKLRSVPEEGNSLLEVVLHNSEAAEDVILEFIYYAKEHGAEPLITRRRDIAGLTFIPVRIDAKRARELAQYSFVRVARGMPTLRPIRPPMLRGTTGFRLALPVAKPMDRSTRAVIFDGGLPATVQAALSPWVSYLEPAGIDEAEPSSEEHGLGVTSAFLFGPIVSGKHVGEPWCHVDHVRVLDKKTGTGADVDCYDVLKRITDHLDQNLGLYDLVNVSLGPNIPIDDDEVNLWTATFDKRFAHGRCVTTVAVGNDGDLDAMAGLNRVQPPSDGVNILSVGSASSVGKQWERADYSCTGPGRCPGIVKPDGLAFGGTVSEPFGVLGSALSGELTLGTSFASPLALRSAASVRVQLGKQLTPLAIRALLIQRAETRKGQLRAEVGWGRFEADPVRLITTDDDEALVIYQGSLPVGEHLRAPLALPPGDLEGRIQVSATLVIAPDVDPEHPSTYTRSGLEVAFRPHSDRFSIRKGKKSKHPATVSFFSKIRLYGKSELALRSDGHKWEPCLRGARMMSEGSLQEPCFDIYYHHREAGMKAADPQPIPYALIVSLKANQVPDFHSRVRQAYSHILVPVRPQTRVPISG